MADLLSIDEVATRLDCPVARVRKLVELGDLHCDEKDRFRGQEVDEYITSLGDPRQHAVTRHLTHALADSQRHLNQVLALLVEPIQKTNKALQDENTSLRAHLSQVMAERLETSQLLADLLQRQAERETERQAAEEVMRMKREAFELLKAQAPIIVESMAGAKFLRAFSTEEIDAVLEHMPLSEVQKDVLRRVATQRRAAETKGTLNDDGSKN